MPLAVRSLSNDELKRLGFDPEDEEFKLLVGAKTMTEIVAALNMTRQQLWKWKNDPGVKRRVEEAEHREQRHAVQKGHRLRVRSEDDCGGVVHALWAPSGCSQPRPRYSSKAR